MITGLFTLQHRATEKGGRETGKKREKRGRGRRWFPDVRWNSEQCDSPPLPLYRERYLDQLVCVVLERIGDAQKPQTRGEGECIVLWVSEEAEPEPAEGKGAVAMRKGMERIEKRSKASRLTTSPEI